jgi:hypothetical protein
MGVARNNFPFVLSFCVHCATIYFNSSFEIFQCKVVMAKAFYFIGLSWGTTTINKGLSGETKSICLTLCHAIWIHCCLMLSDNYILSAAVYYILLCCMWERVKAERSSLDIEKQEKEAEFKLSNMASSSTFAYTSLSMFIMNFALWCSVFICRMKVGVLHVSVEQPNVNESWCTACVSGKTKWLC